ncbi:iron-containing alcohol dehydrogenase family protein [Gulosibacter faecalis]|jgi:alcohol dehydrogenase class IV|uniref:Iron-containing alcohol dehydrogenase family protein n=1 Tax=Gulosibacter faecalis TaxID=272240 RepID=A0ABW5V3G0_9MICO|nr:iron-containing alcohol dehydrogenase [Gulosibacter faecalis]
MTSALWWPNPVSDSIFLAPAAVIGGTGSARRLPEILRGHSSYDTGAVLLAVDDAVANAGLIEPIEAALRDGGIEVVVRGGFGAEPTAEVVDEVATAAREAKATAVIGVGGGSVLDSAKLIALLLRQGGGAADWVGPVADEVELAPLVLIPTTVGTGSEATNIAMVTVDGAKRASVCSRFVPEVAVLDPELVASLPKQVIAATGMDALAHSVEALMSTKASMLSAHSSFHTIELLIANLEAAYGGDAEALARTQWASHLGGQALNAGVVVGHSIAYSFAHATPMPHGVSCALALPYCIAYNQHLAPGLAARLALALTNGESDSLRDAATATQELARRMGLPTTLAEARIEPDQVDEIARYCNAEYQRPTNPEPMDEPRLRELVAAAETGDLDAAFRATAHS